LLFPATPKGDVGLTAVAGTCQPIAASGNPVLRREDRNVEQLQSIRQ